MANKFIPVPAEAIEGKLCDKGFLPEKQGREVVYTRKGKMASALTLKVYSSVTEGALSARAKDTDAIRVVLVADVGQGRREQVLYTRKILRVNSVEGVLERIWEACAEAAQEGLKVRHVCPVCGAPAYSDTGRCIVRNCRQTKPQVPTAKRLQERLPAIQKRAGFELSPGTVAAALKGEEVTDADQMGGLQVSFKTQGAVVMVTFRTADCGRWIEERWAV